MKFRGGEFSTGTTGNFQPELTVFVSRRTFTTQMELLVGTTIPDLPLGRRPLLDQAGR